MGIHPAPNYYLRAVEAATRDGNGSIQTSLLFFMLFLLLCVCSLKKVDVTK